MLNLNFRAGAASRYGSGFIKMMRLLAAPAPQHCKNITATIGFLIASKQRCVAGAASFW
jgi:hypothetical protein